MEQKRIGRTGLSVPPLIVGGNVFGWSVNEAASFTILDAAMAHGLNGIDTADIYSYWAPGNRGGESETIIGKWLKHRGRRDDVIIHTKGGAPGAPGEFSDAKLTAGYLTKAVEASLRRLQTDYIDLYYVHYDDKVTPPEETLGAFQRLIEQGKIRAIGASNYEPDRLRQALATADAQGLPRFACLQTLYNLYDRASYETELQSLCAEQGLGMMSYFSLASGFLTGKYRTQHDLAKSAVRGEGVRHYLNPRGLRILDALDAISRRHDATPAQIALAWLMAHPSVTAPVASATNLAQLKDLAASTRIKLWEDDYSELDTASVPNQDS